MHTIESYFKSNKELMPAWLLSYRRTSTLDFKEILSGRLVYYAGSALDGEVIKTFNTAHAAHTYIYVDYMLQKERVVNHIKGRGLLGYKVYHLREFDLNNLKISDEHQETMHAIEKERDALTNDFSINEYGLLAIFERLPEFNENHGAERIALIYLSTDAVTAYLKLFNKERAPFINVLQDHSMGGNYTTFGRHGLLEKISIKHSIKPLYSYVGSNTRPWSNYARLGVAPTKLYYRFRYLFRRAV